MGRLVAIVPHTHWDREWYSPFQTFRLRLVDMLDDLLPRLDADPSYAHFMLDGQMAVVDDYLAVRPEAEPALRRLAAACRTSMGPWYALPDEFLVSGETLVRNLQIGLERATAFGGAMEVGYLPDMFGHVAQMPQLLRQLGFEHAVVWRGVPDAIRCSGFWWRSPDGSTVRAEYLPEGYGNGAPVPDDAKALIAEVTNWSTVYEKLLVGPILWMDGTDHMAPQPWLGRVVAEANELQDDFEFVVTSLRRYVEQAPTDSLPSWDGELRSGARANLLMGVASNRVDVKQAAARAERALERLAEPLSALHLPAERWPASLLAEAWLYVVRNSAHDSVCACSVDEVCDAVLHRYAEAAQIAEGLADRAVGLVAASVPGNGPVIVNPSSRGRSGVVELSLHSDEPIPGTQVVSVRPPDSVLGRFDTLAMGAVVARQLDYVRSIRTATLERDDGTVLFRAERSTDGRLLDAAGQAELDALGAGDDIGPVTIRTTQAPRQRVLARVDDVAGYGWRSWVAAPLTVPPVAVSDEGLSISNGLIDLRIDPASATFSLDGVSGLGRLVDGGDVGDTYNWCPPVTDTEVSTPDSVTIEVLEAGPVRARVAIDAVYQWFEHTTNEGRRGEIAVPVRTIIDVRAGERLVRVETSFVNRVRDHRLRAWFPLPAPAARSAAECAFTVVERGLTAEGGPSELGLPTFPCRRFVSAGGLTVLHDGLLEYELVDIAAGRARALALTLLRCTGLLSQAPMTTRPVPAGPMVPTEGAQMQGNVSFRYAVQAGDADPFALADDFLVPLAVTRAGGGGGTPDGQALAVQGAEVSALRRSAGGHQLELRVFNPTPSATTVKIEGRRGWLVDLRGRPLEPFEGSFELAPFGIATAVLG